MIGLIAYIALAVAVGFWAHKYYRNGWTWALLAFFISPVIAGIFLFVSGPAEPPGRTCPNCVEKNRKSAQVCRFCGFDFVANSMPSKEA